MARYIQKNLAEARDEGFPPPYWFGDQGWDVLDHDYNDYNYYTGIWFIQDNGALDFIACDGGEPEDQTLDRDFAWVLDALNAAFENGFEFGYAKGLNNGD